MAVGMTSGFFTGLVLGLALWAVVIWWHRSRLAKADKVWLDVIRSYPTSSAKTVAVGYDTWAPDWAEANIRRVLGPVPKKKAKRRK